MKRMVLAHQEDLFAQQDKQYPQLSGPVRRTVRELLSRLILQVVRHEATVKGDSNDD